VIFWVGSGGGGGSLGAGVIGWVVFGFKYGLGVRGLWVSMLDVFWVIFGLLFSVGVFGLRFQLCGQSGKSVEADGLLHSAD